MSAVCNLMTDSCCDLTRSFLDENHVGVLHYPYTEVLDSGQLVTHVDDLFQSISAHDFYDAIRMGASPKTAQLPLAQVEECFRACLTGGVPTVFVMLSSGISGCYETCCATLERVRAELGDAANTEFYLVDSRLGSTAQALLVVEAIRQRDRGLSAAELARWVEEARNYIHTLFVVDDLVALSRGGRIPTGLAVAGNLLAVKPLLSFDLDGKLALSGMARGRKKAIRKLADTYLADHVAGLYQNVAALGNADCPADMRHLAEMLCKEDDSLMLVETSIGPTIGCHVGADMLSCCFWGADRRQSEPPSDRIARAIRQD